MVTGILGTPYILYHRLVTHLPHPSPVHLAQSFTDSLKTPDNVTCTFYSSLCDQHTEHMSCHSLGDLRTLPAWFYFILITVMLRRNCELLPSYSLGNKISK